MNVYESVTDLIGKTPLLRLENLETAHGLYGKVYAKLEYFNPAGSVKDRVAFEMILDAEKSGRLAPGGTVIEPTSGNTGIGLCAVCAARGYHAVIVMPDTMSEERRLLVKAYGADLVLTDGKRGMTGAIAKAEEMQKQIPNSLVAGQFVNPSNPAAHYKTTGPEIFSDLDGKVDAFVAGVGTGGTITGIGGYLKEKNPCVKVVAVEPDTSAVLSGEPAGAHGLQGIGAGFIPVILNTKVYDEIIKVSTEEAYAAAREVAERCGVLVGISSGAALVGAMKIAARPEMKGKNVAVLLPDTGERYLSTPLYKG